MMKRLCHFISSLDLRHIDRRCDSVNCKASVSLNEKTHDYKPYCYMYKDYYTSIIKISGAINFPLTECRLDFVFK